MHIIACNFSLLIGRARSIQSLHNLFSILAVDAYCIHIHMYVQSFLRRVNTGQRNYIDINFDFFFIIFGFPCITSMSIRTYVHVCFLLLCELFLAFVLKLIIASYVRMLINHFLYQLLFGRTKMLPAEQTQKKSGKNLFFICTLVPSITR